MKSLALIGLLNGNSDIRDHRPEFHADRRAAEAAMAEKRACARPALLDRILPAAFRTALARRRDRQVIERALARLAATSPHLLDDVGMAPVADMLAMKAHARHLADDVALGADAAETRVPGAPRRWRHARFDGARAEAPAPAGLAAE